MTADPPTSHVPPNLFHPSPDVLHAALATEMTVNLWLHGAAARHGTRRYGGQSRDTMPLPPLSVAFSAAPGAQRGGTRHASRIVLDAAAHYPTSRLFQRPPSVRRNVWTTVGERKSVLSINRVKGSSMESSNRSMDKAKENPYVVLSGLLLQVILPKSDRDGRLFYKLMIDIRELHILIYRDN
ncbi:hypothetical protein TRIUR3_11211 [Triticum urartu]|uniref:Uncharacterized protein n=1 Tax=Triticum urartu TaxID=4572 RepID=M8B035_TRIUA|nr:hypothetical protein TRIUR3_11211 [Triticum urartu]